MSDLTEKFDALEAQLASQHTVISNDLTAILAALGAPPPGDITTLDDIAAQLTGISNQLASIASANGTFYTALLDVTGLISTNLETLSNNNSLNSSRLLQAIYATACQCPTPTDLLTPPIDVTPTSLADEAKCRRIQFYLSLFGNWLTKIANYGAAAGFVTGESIYQLLAIVVANAGIVATGAEVGAAAGPPGIVVGAVVGLIILAISTFGGAALNDYAAQFNAPTMQSALLTALFAATNADEGYTAFKSTILANMDDIPAQIIYTLWWSAWSNDIYSGSPVVDDSAFDGSICVDEPTDLPSITSCTIFASTPFPSGGDIYHVIKLEPEYSGFAGGIAGDYNGWSVRVTAVTETDTVQVYYWDTGGTLHFYHEGTYPSGPWTFGPTSAIIIQTGSADSDGRPFEVEICPPGS